MFEVDARGRGCPEPVLMTKKALANHKDGLEVLVDNVVAVENITRFANQQGYKVDASEQDGEFRLVLSR